LRRLVEEDGAALILISHDLAAVAAIADRLAIMRKGRIVESGEAPTIFRSLRHPYSRALISAASTRRPARLRLQAERSPLLQVEGVSRHYRRRGSASVPGKTPRGVSDVSFVVHSGETLAVVGESGSGKTTLARIVLALERPHAGRVLLNGTDFHAARGAELHALRRTVQAVFQDPYGSFDPRTRIWRSIAEPLALEPGRASPGARRKRVDAALAEVGLSSSDGDKYPHEFSGGERQRLAIARALITRPALIVLDEPVSAIDASLRAQVLDLLADIRESHGLAYLFISHDLAVVRALAARVLVMQEGQLIEQGETEAIFARPRHPYTAALVASVPDLERALRLRESGDVTRVAAPPASTIF
jgi:peptide/nickel transport system ATP-binding protein